ncbi:MAG TPA: hypothetical protein VIP11_21290 [Gemmatimonadaceae bacterium]
MSTFDELFARMQSELDRLGLSLETYPFGGLAADTDALAGMIDRLRKLEPPVSWWDVIPDIPAHWIEGKPETWTTPYRPLGPYDYQELPTGPAFHIAWPKGTDPSRLDEFVDEMRRVRWKVYGAGFIETTNPNPDWPSLDAFLVMERRATSDQFDELFVWLEARSDIQFCGSPRNVRDGYL